MELKGASLTIEYLNSGPTDDVTGGVAASDDANDEATALDDETGDIMPQGTDVDAQSIDSSDAVSMLGSRFLILQQKL